MLSAAEVVAEIAALALFIATILIWSAILERCHYHAGPGLLACVFG